MKKTHGIEDRPRTEVDVPNDWNRAASNAHIQWLGAKAEFDEWCSAAFADGRVTAAEAEEGQRLMRQMDRAKTVAARTLDLWKAAGRPKVNDPNP